MAKSKIATVMREFKAGKLKSGGKRVVRSRKQALAIAFSEAGASKKRKTRTKSRRKRS